MRILKLALLLLAITAGTAPGATLTTIYSFTGGDDGREPFAGLTAGPDGTLYGATAIGGTSRGGTIFKLNRPVDSRSRWTETVLHSFGGNDGYVPLPLIFGRDQAIYGVAQIGGISGFSGVAFRLAPPVPDRDAWREQVILDFSAATGQQPTVGLTQGPRGSFYGTTSAGGEGCRPIGCGVVFALATPTKGHAGWAETVVHQFAGGQDGAYPNNVVFRGDALYGTTGGGGLSDGGVVYKLSPANREGTHWDETVLHSFAAFGSRGPDGSNPEGTLTIDRSGALFGTTVSGGSGCSCGTVFRLTRPVSGRDGWTEAAIYAFTGGGEGSFPYSGVIFDSEGSLYGAASQAGAGGSGTIFKLVPPAFGQTSWTHEVLHSFSGPDGASPEGTLLIDDTGTVYGTTVSGGPYNAGTVFQLTP